MKKILLMSLSGELGGMEFRIADEARFLLREGCEPSIAINFFPELERWILDVEHSGIPIFDYNPPPFFEEWRWRRLNKMRARITGTRLLKRLKPDLAHVFFAWTETGGTRLWLAHKCGIPTVLSVRNTFPPHKFVPWNNKLVMEAFASVRGIYGISQSALDHFLEIYGQFVRRGTVLSVIHNYVDTDRYRPSSILRNEMRSEFGIPEGAPVIGSVGRLSDQKRPKALIDIFGKLQKELPDAYLVLVGQGHLEGALRCQVASLGLTNRVKFTGFQTNPERIIPAFDVHLLLSVREGFGIVTVEAMACGVPVVASDVPGSADILAGSEGGILVPLDDEAATVSSLLRILTNREHGQRMSERARAEVVAKFGKPIWERRLREFYGAVSEVRKG